jgi:serine/threonine protein kinase
VSSCPSDETLTGLLADALTLAERDSLARHVEGCAPCQEKLARLTGTPDTERWRRAGRPPRGSADEEGMVRRLKRVTPPSPARRREQANGSAGASPRAEGPPQAVLDTEPPAVPGYRILGELGRGGMGVVYQARQVALQRTVALKMVQTGTHVGPKELARFRAEAGVIARLQHPNIVQIYDIGEAGGRPYFALEFLAGGSLAQYLRGTPQPARPAAQLVETLARAVHAAHSSGVVHRDLKPANVLLQKAEGGSRKEEGGGSDSAFGLPPSAFGLPKITDFGVAKCIAGDGEAPGLPSPTVTGEVIGTPQYMAPEQAAPRRQPVGPAADIYALGAILYEMLTGRPPFTGETSLDTLVQVVHNEPVSVTRLQPTVPRDLETICLKCLRKEPRKRYGSALELAEDLQRFLRDEPIRARPVTAMEKLGRWVRHHPVPAGLLAAGLLAPVVALTALSLLSAELVRSSALDSVAQQAELLEEATEEYSRTVQRVEEARYPVNKTVPPTPGTVPLTIPATFLHNLGEQLGRTGTTGVQVRQYSDFPFPWRTDGGPRDDFERAALRRLRESNGQETVHEFTEIGGRRVVRYAQARILQRSCVECHNTHPRSPCRTWREGDVRGVLEIIRPLDKDEARVAGALRLALLLSAVVSCLLLGASLLVVWAGRRRARVGS